MVASGLSTANTLIALARLSAQVLCKTPTSAGLHHGKSTALIGAATAKKKEMHNESITTSVLAVLRHCKMHTIITRYKSWHDSQEVLQTPTAP